MPVLLDYATLHCNPFHPDQPSCIHGDVPMSAHSVESAGMMMNINYHLLKVWVDHSIHPCLLSATVASVSI